MRTKITLAGYAIAAFVAALTTTPAATGQALPPNWDASCSAAKQTANEYQACITHQLDLNRKRQSPAPQGTVRPVEPTPFPGIPPSPATCRANLKVGVPDAASHAVLAAKGLTQRIGESDDAYLRRIRPLVRGLAPVHIEFSAPSSALSYDPARDAYWFSPDHLSEAIAPIESLSLDSDRFWFSYQIDASHRPDRKYQAQNMFGAKFVATMASGSRLSYVFAGAAKSASPLPAISFQNPHPGKDVSIFRIVIEGDAIAPYFFEDEDAAKPTFHNRYGHSHKFIGVPFVPRCGAVVDEMGGKTVAIFDPSNLSAF